MWGRVMNGGCHDQRFTGEFYDQVWPQTNIYATPTLLPYPSKFIRPVYRFVRIPTNKVNEVSYNG